MNKRQEMLVITMEECAELSQACSKLIRFEDDQSEQDIKNLQDEIGIPNLFMSSPKIKRV